MKSVRDGGKIIFGYKLIRKKKKKNVTCIVNPCVNRPVVEHAVGNIRSVFIGNVRGAVETDR